jgi:hypothetical protein
MFNFLKRFHSTKSKMTPTRSYNNLLDCGETFIKSSINREKIQAEIFYYENLPVEVKKYHPKFYGSTTHGTWTDGYQLQKIPNFDLSVFLTENYKFKSDELTNLFSYISKYFNDIPKKAVSKETWLEAFKEQIFERNFERLKTLERIIYFNEIQQVFNQSSFRSLYEFIEKVHLEIILRINQIKHYEIWFSHGDLCFSNMIINNQALILIDPRGIQHSIENAYLVPYYDFAKLSQGIFGNYDFINHNSLVSRSKKNFDTLQAEFRNLITDFNLDFNLVRLVECTHFFAMMPLHMENKEKVLKFAKECLKTFQEVSSQ